MRKLFILFLLFFMIVLNGMVFNVLEPGEHGHKEETTHKEETRKKAHTDSPKEKKTHSRPSSHNNM